MNQFINCLRKALLFLSRILLAVYHFFLKALEAMKEKDITSNAKSLFAGELYID